MPAISKKQYRFMQAVAHGSVKKAGLSKSKAKEFVTGVDYKSLPMSKSMHGSGQFSEEEMHCGYKKLG